jgi:hypothetical protein
MAWLVSTVRGADIVVPLLVAVQAVSPPDSSGRSAAATRNAPPASGLKPQGARIASSILIMG